jgi:hypothetical protein
MAVLGHARRRRGLRQRLYGLIETADELAGSAHESDEARELHAVSAAIEAYEDTCGSPAETTPSL